MSTNDGGPAFPNAGVKPESELASMNGMSLRDYFAAKAMNAIVSTYIQTHRGLGDDPEDLSSSNRDSLIDNGDGLAEVAHDAYLIADAMLAARQAPNTGAKE